jgi:hypothetical protein
LKLTELTFGSLLAYCPNDYSERGNHARMWMARIKNDYFVTEIERQKTILTSDFIAAKIKQNLDQLAFKHFFGQNVALVPIPRSSLITNDTLWVPDRLAQALQKSGLGTRQCLLTRVRTVNRSSQSAPKDRPSPNEHYNSLSAKKELEIPEQIVLVDDVITRGHTMMGAAWRIQDIYPNTPIFGFAAMRAIHNIALFKNWYDPVVGTVNYRLQEGDCIRSP